MAQSFNVNADWVLIQCRWSKEGTAPCVISGPHGGERCENKRTVCVCLYVGGCVCLGLEGFRGLVPGHPVPILTNAHHSEKQTKQSLPVVDQQQLSAPNNVALLLKGPVT